MDRNNFYEKLTDELLACFYYFIQGRISRGNNLNVLREEIRLIEEAAQKRGISLAELKFLGHITIQNEVSITNEEDK